MSVPTVRRQSREGHHVDMVGTGRHAGLWTRSGPLVGCSVHDPFANLFSVSPVRARDFPWTNTLSMLYIDNPVSTGGPVTGQCGPLVFLLLIQYI